MLVLIMIELYELKFSMLFQPSCGEIAETKTSQNPEVFPVHGGLWSQFILRSGDVKNAGLQSFFSSLQNLYQKIFKCKSNGKKKRQTYRKLCFDTSGCSRNFPRFHS